MQKPTWKKIASAVKKSKGESSRMRRDCTMRAFSKVMRSAARVADRGRWLSILKVRYEIGMTATPNIAGKRRIGR